MFKVAIIAGGLAHERDISIRSGRRVARVLIDAGYDVEVWDLDQRLTERIKEWQPDVIWPLVHGSQGEDGSLQEFLALSGVPHVGSDGIGARLASNKPTAKSVLAVEGIATPPWVTLSQELFRQVGTRAVLDAVVAGIGFPLVVKPANGGSALGVTIVNSIDELPGAMVNCFAYGNEALIEQFIDGTEVSASIVELDGPGSAEALPLVEVTADGGYDFDARYNAGRALFFTPARLSEELTEKVSRVALEIHSHFALGELSRIDFIIDKDGMAWTIDINVAPGMTETSLFPQAAGDRASELYSGIVQSAAKKKQKPVKE